MSDDNRGHLAGGGEQGDPASDPAGDGEPTRDTREVSPRNDAPAAGTPSESKDEGGAISDAPGRRPREVDLGPLPRRLGRYEVLGVIGSGGMGTVFRARQVQMDRIVALKVLAPELARDKRYLKRFVR